MAKKKSGDVNALIIFVDARGFTAWSEKVDNFKFIDAFSKRWYELLKSVFNGGCSVKYLGDGAMIVQEIEEETTEEILKGLLSGTIKKIEEIDTSFLALCKEFSVKKGSEIPLTLGWGITKGTVKKVDGEYIGAEVNKSARYCSIARPYGIVIDAVDFQSLPEDLPLKFHRQERILSGIDRVLGVWVSKEIHTQFLTREHLKESPEVHVAGLCFRKEKDDLFVLLGKRSKERKLFPGLFEGCGGQLARNELFVEGVERHYRLEFGLEVSVVEDVHDFYYIQQSNEPLIQGVRFLCEYISGEPKSLNHEPPTPKWYSKDEFNKISEKEFIPGLKDTVKIYFEKYSAFKSKKQIRKTGTVRTHGLA